MKHVLSCHLIILSSLLLAGCGFEPMASTQSKSTSGHALSTELASVRVEVTTSRHDQRLLAQQFRTRLEDLLDPGQLIGGEKQYVLYVNLSPIITPSFIAPDGKAQRFIVNLMSSYQLVRPADNKTIEQGALNRNSSYSNLPNSYFSTYIAEQDTTKRLAEELAEEYRMRLASLITSPPETPNKQITQPIIPPSTRPESAVTIPGIGQ